MKHEFPQGFKIGPELRRAMDQSRLDQRTFQERCIEVERVDQIGGWVNDDIRDLYLAKIVTGQIAIGS